ncbi:FUSC family protein [Streptosporangium amethystogenes]|uniref:FUSC family protein n=1 Tax=Streptosporangium amethystogenes TaxID=2002 RepID=UPI0004C50F34|nr:FUSC family protein [Streptosporangium amethystogenes]
MRGLVDMLRADFRLSGRPAWSYGLLCMLVVCLPLLLGVLLGRLAEGASVALGGYLTLFGDAPGQLYGDRVRGLLTTTTTVTLGSGLGALIHPHPWPIAAVVVGLVAAAGIYWRALGIPAILSVTLAYFAPSTMGVLLHMGASACGGLLAVLTVMTIWPLRRRRPLRRTVEEAGMALADLLAGGGRAPLADESWESLRHRAATALKDLEAALSLYRVAGEDDGASERLPATLTRIFQQTIALRVLRAAAVEAQAGTEWTRELDEAIGALARALREAALLGGSAEMPGALAAVGRFADSVEEIRRTARAGDTPLPAAALLGQVTRCVDRIAMAVRSVEQQAAESVEVGPRLPKFVRSRKPVITTGYHPIRVGLAVTAAMVLMLVIHEHYAKWFVVTVAVSLRPTYRDTVDRVRLRVLGTAVGAVAGAVVLAVAPGHLYLTLFVSVCAALGFALRGCSYGYWMMLATPLSLMLADFALSLDWGAAAARVVLTIAGGVLALLFARLLWSRGHRATLAAAVAEMLDRHAALVRSLIDQDPKEVNARISSASDATGRLADSLDKLDKEPGGGAPRRLRDAVTVAGRLRDNALALFAIPPPGNEFDPTVTVLDLVADRLEKAAEGVRTDRPGTPPDDLDRALDELGAYVDELAARRLDELAEGAGDRMTGLRRSIRHAAAARPALRGLGAEAVRLAALTAPRTC